ncbi:substrate-binding domain-containing protein, partial [Paenibacillus sepulcri]|nr:substrate-binding domain-containing protein [Paenibacillus sepulcri]
REHQLTLRSEHLVRYTTEEKLVKPAAELSALLGQAAGERPTAIVCYNDELAVKLLDVVRGKGLTVPEDLSMVGFDDATLATATEVKLTTLEHPKTRMGEDAVKLLIRLLGQGGSRKPEADIIYEPRLIVRESTAPDGEEIKN